MTTKIAIRRQLRVARKHLCYVVTEAKGFLFSRDTLPPQPTGRRIEKGIIPLSQNAFRLTLFVVLLVFFILKIKRKSSVSRDALGGEYVWMSSRSGRYYVPLIPEHSNPSEKTGVSIVAACKNRHEFLAAVLPSWLRTEGVDEIILVDWDSDPPLSDSIKDSLDDERLRIIRVDGEEDWVLSRAYNLGISLTRTKWIVRLDCDCRLGPNFVHAHLKRNETLESSLSFWSGQWQHARTEEEVHLNGALLVQKKHFVRVHGYDERIQTYGWDDEDLYIRLVASQLMRRVLDYDQLEHMKHTDTLRQQRDVPFADVNIDYNSLLLNKLPTWNGSWTLASPSANGTEEGTENRLRISSYEWRNRRHARLRTRTIPPSLATLVPPHAREEAWTLALGRRLHDGHDVPWDMLTNLGARGRQTLLGQLRALDDTKASARLVVVHVMHGLGNRLRALGSAMAFARRARRVVIVVWEVDAHCGARFGELFEGVRGGELVVVEGIGLTWPFVGAEGYDAAWGRWDLYNYMEREGGDARKGMKVWETGRNVYFKGAYVMESEGIGWDVTNVQLRRLIPIREVRKVVDSVTPRLRRSVGVHVRHRDMSSDIDGITADKEYGSFETRVVAYWRSISAPTAFIPAVSTVQLETGLHETFVAADSNTAREEVMHGVQEAWTLPTGHVNCVKNGRNAPCMQRALMELLCLSRTRVLVGSMWSSFSEAAARLGDVKLRLIGVDFNDGEDVDVAERFGSDVVEFVRGVRERRARRRVRGRRG